MFGTVEIKSRPIKLAYLVEPNNDKQVTDAIRLSSTLWGGAYFPIIPLHRRMPATWREGPMKVPQANKVIHGYLDAFDPDVLVRFSEDIPDFVTKLGLQVITPEEIWKGLTEGRSLSPRYGVGIFEILNDVYDQYFKYKAKYPVQVAFPVIPRKFSLFWRSVFGEVPTTIDALVQKHYSEALDIIRPDIDPTKVSQLLKADVLFPRRISRHATKQENGPRFGRDACLYFLDATKTEDIVDFWNLRAMGRDVMPLPKQLAAEPDMNGLAVSFLQQHRRPWRHDPKVCDFASIVRGRSCKMDEVQEYAKTLKIAPIPGDVSDSPYFAIQHWYPRLWDEWARDKDGAPADLYGSEEDSVDIDSVDSAIRFRTVVPKFAERYGGYGSARCANEISLRTYGSETLLAEAFPKFAGRHFNRSISGGMSSRGDWRVGRNGLVKLVKYFFNESRTIPTAESVLFSWLRDLGWSPKLSPPGILANQIYARLEGSCFILHNETVLKLIDRMNGGRGNGGPEFDQALSKSAN